MGGCDGFRGDDEVAFILAVLRIEDNDEFAVLCAWLVGFVVTRGCLLGWVAGMRVGCRLWVDSLKAAIVSSIESNWCATSVGEGISASFLPLTAGQGIWCLVRVGKRVGGYTRVIKQKSPFPIFQKEEETLEDNVESVADTNISNARDRSGATGTGN